MNSIQKLTCLFMLICTGNLNAQLRKIYYPEFSVNPGSFVDFEKTDCKKENKIETCTFLFSDAADEPKKNYIGTFESKKHKADSWSPRSQIVYEGKGIITYKNGDIHEGKFSYYVEKNQKTGIYIYTDAFTPANHAYVYKNEIWTFPNGDKLRGPSIYIPERLYQPKNKVHTDLMYTFSNGDEIVSSWSYGIPVVNQAPTLGSFKPNGKLKMDGAYSLVNGLIEFNSGNFKIQFEPAIESLVKCLSGDCLTGIGKKRYEDGTIYEGEFVNGAAKGQGVLTTKDFTYTGTFKDGEFFGAGTQVYVNGDIYQSNYWTGTNKFTFGSRTVKDGKEEVGKRHDYFLAGKSEDDPIVKSATAALMQKNTNVKTYVFQSQCNAGKGNFNVISKIDADISKHSFDEIENRARHALANNGWHLQTALKYLGTSDVVKINGTPGRDYSISADSINDF